MPFVLYAILRFILKQAHHSVRIRGGQGLPRPPLASILNTIKPCHVVPGSVTPLFRARGENTTDSYCVDSRIQPIDTGIYGPVQRKAGGMGGLL